MTAITTDRSALFLDRDGTIITDEHFLNDPERIRLMPGAATSIALANGYGIPVIIVTNQSESGAALFPGAVRRRCRAIS